MAVQQQINKCKQMLQTNKCKTNKQKNLIKLLSHIQTNLLNINKLCLSLRQSVMHTDLVSSKVTYCHTDQQLHECKATLQSHGLQKQPCSAVHLLYCAYDVVLSSYHTDLPISKHLSCGVMLVWSSSRRSSTFSFSFTST